MQMSVYGKIIDTCPKDLPTYIKQMEYKQNCMQRVPLKDKTKISLALHQAQRYSGNHEELLFRVPTDLYELIDEFVSQATSISIPAEEIMENKKTVIFVRKPSAPDSPYITACVDKEGNVTAYRAKNEAVPDNEMEIIREWVVSVDAA